MTIIKAREVVRARPQAETQSRKRSPTPSWDGVSKRLREALGEKLSEIKWNKRAGEWEGQIGK